ncbi:MAG: co-chaperone DjlA [Gammaproteobacteria bacterium]|nr:co-chaperone DjlA [Gammaproteobacteria bacterium]
MKWSGKLIGGALGYLLGGPVGAALGLVAGHQFDDAGEREALGADSAARVHELYFPAVFRVMGHVAKADGRVSEQEIAAARAVMAALRLGPEQVRQAIGYFTEGKQADFSLDGALSELRPLLRAYPQLAQFFMEIQLQATLAGNGLSARPRARLQRTASLLGLGSEAFARLEALMRWRMSGGSGGYAGGGATGGAGGAPGNADPLRQAYVLLETTAGASDEQVIKAWRRQMSRNHPDKLQANGLPESMLERAKERTQQIQAAYELVRAARGMR